MSRHRAGTKRRGRRERQKRHKNTTIRILRRFASQWEQKLKRRPLPQIDWNTIPVLPMTSSEVWNP